MATNTNYGNPLTGLDAQLASLPIDDAVRGGTQEGFNGVSQMARKRAVGAEPAPTTPPTDQTALQGKGELLEADDATVFKTCHNLWLRQERLARNRYAQDRHWLAVRAGFAFSRLEKDDNQDVWTQSFPPGYVKSLRSPSIPNKADDLCNKYVEVLLSDFPKADPQPKDNSETARRGAEIAQRFLAQESDDVGVNLSSVMWQQWDRAMCTASTFNHHWVDPVGGGSIPLQIEAHPEAPSPENPLVGPDGMPSVNPILRYVTADQGQGRQFTDDPSQADRQWIPQARIDRLGREHVRLFPEHQDIDGSTTVMMAYFCTLGEGKRRWPSIAALDPGKLSALCDWTPPRYLVLLPPALRARWKLQTGGPGDAKGGSDDQRYFFYYCLYKKNDPDYPEGAQVYVSGMDGGFIIGRDTLTATVQVPNEQVQDQDVPLAIRMEIPIVQNRPIQDALDLDPTGLPLIGRFAGASEAGQQLMQAYAEACDIILHPARFVPSTSPVEGEDIDNSRATGDVVPILSMADLPKWEEPPQLPGSTMQMAEFMYAQADSIAGLPKPLQGSNDQQEVSGVARNIAVQQGMIALGRSQVAFHLSFKRSCRIMIQQAMKYYSAPQQIRYVGDDGSYQQKWWTGAEFASVTSEVNVMPGTGTMMPPLTKVQNAAAMMQMGALSQEEFQEVARPNLVGGLGITANPHDQRAERQIAAWMEGPPQGWDALQQTYLQQKQQYDQAEAQYQQQQQAYQVATQNQAIVNAGPPPTTLGSQQQYDQASLAYATAQQALQLAPLGPPPQAPQIPAPTQPWTPFDELPIDTDPLVAALRQRKMGRVMAEAAFTGQRSKLWRDELVRAYTLARQAVALSQQAQQQAKQPQVRPAESSPSPAPPVASPKPAAAAA